MRINRKISVIEVNELPELKTGRVNGFNFATFAFMLPCIVIDFFLNNQTGELIIQIYSVIKLYMFRAFSLPIIRNFLLYIRQW
jgi:hypothetical protein